MREKTYLNCYLVDSLRFFLVKSLVSFVYVNVMNQTSIEEKEGEKEVSSISLNNRNLLEAKLKTFEKKIMKNDGGRVKIGTKNSLEQYWIPWWAEWKYTASWRSSAASSPNHLDNFQKFYSGGSEGEKNPHTRWWRQTIFGISFKLLFFVAVVLSFFFCLF